MPILTQSLNAWNSKAFNRVFIDEVGELSLQELPLQQGLQTGSYATKDNLKIMLNSTTETDHSLEIDTGIFFSSILAGCNCSDDPTPVDLMNEYCEMKFIIDKCSAETTIIILS